MSPDFKNALPKAATIELSQIPTKTCFENVLLPSLINYVNHAALRLLLMLCQFNVKYRPTPASHINLTPTKLLVMTTMMII